jgi:orotate phosphoribosyltransferase
MLARRHALPERIHQPFSLFRTDTPLKAHPGYVDAKGGRVEAATELVLALALPFLVETTKNLPSSACFVAPHAREATGDNAIPQVLAAACALAAGGSLDTDIVQITRVFHTGADPKERMASRPEFEGIVTPDSDYVLVDDVTTMGGTLAELASYIQALGGKVAGVVVLVNAGRLEELHPSKSTLSKLKSRYEHEIPQLFGIQPEALTANEASYLIGFRTADEMRNRLAKAREETNRRLRSKGLEK